MRRSKSDPAKYARNYRKISQRRMTQFDETVDENEEIRRLRAILQSSEKHLKRIEEPSSSPVAGNRNNNNNGMKRKRKSNGSGEEEHSSNKDNPQSSILSQDLLEESSSGFGEDNDLVILPSKKKKQESKSSVVLSPEEIREAKLLHKKTAKKLQQLEARAAQKKRRNDLYKRLEQTAVVSPSSLQPLLSSSGKLSRKETDTKKQTLKKLLNKERAGLMLTKEENDLLYPTRDVDDDDLKVESNSLEQSNSEVPHATKDIEEQTTNKKKKKKKRKKSASTASEESDASDKHKISFSTEDESTLDEDGNEDLEGIKNSEPLKQISASQLEKEMDDGKKVINVQNESISNDDVAKKTVPVVDFAAQMMASLTKLKSEASDTKTKGKESLEERMTKEDASKPKSRYTPSDPSVLKTAASLGLSASPSQTSADNGSSDVKVMKIQRPPDIEKSRYDLPVSAMEFEIIDAIRNNDVTIVCGETGSGKSTQVPQFIYENGMTLHPKQQNSSFIVGVTQPRRVAAVSTAKRVCFEMGQGNGQSIRNGPRGVGNLVAYKTRYETAGMGSSTQVQFMTDGILLQEIQSDLLLRRYSVIVLDESHERNLNTDVLIGLLSKAIPLRKKAAQEDPDNIVPLKLVLMSATLRVEDFTKNDALFPSGPPAVVSVPGRTFPVTIHHSKVTELENYELVAFRKICKIHRSLPRGGILVFLTGKAEIIRMVTRLRRKLESAERSSRFVVPDDTVGSAVSTNPDNDIPRELDDEELDADETGVDDFDDLDTAFDESDVSVPQTKSDDETDAIPKRVRILPLYSLLSAEEQAKVFAPVGDDERLIVVSTNVAETSITIPGISYVVDTGRQKCRNYNSGTGIASYDIMWISKASANQRAGRAGRTGPGHCYRLYSSSLFSRYMDSYALPEILTRPLEDVVLAMKALKVSNVSTFPFPTPPDRSQIDSAVKVLSNIGCVDTSRVEFDGGDGVVTRLGKAVAQLPLGVRYAKMLLVAAQAGVLDYAIVVVAVLSEANPFSHHAEPSNEGDEKTKEEADREGDNDEDLDEIDKNLAKEQEAANKRRSKKWNHHGGDVLAAMLAVGAYTYAGRGAGGSSEALANRRFCEENGLNYTIMTRIQKMRAYLASIAKNRLASASGVAAVTGGFSYKMAPPTKLQERLLMQSITSGLLDHVAVLAPPGSMTGNNPTLRSAYMLCTSGSGEALFLDTTSVLYSRSYQQLPRWVCFDSILRKTTKDGTPLAVMKNVTPVDASWLGDVAKGTPLLSFGAPLLSPPPVYDSTEDNILCAVGTKFGSHGWEIPPVKQIMYNAIHDQPRNQAVGFQPDDSYRWFARFLLEGKIFPELEALELNDSPALITRRSPLAKVNLLVGALAGVGVDSASALRKHWADADDKFLFKHLKPWIKADDHPTAKKVWIGTVQSNIKQYQADR